MFVFCWHLLGLQGSCWLRYKGLLPASPNYIRSRKEYLLCSYYPRVPLFPYCLLLVAKLSSQEQSSQGSRLLGWASCSGPLSEVLMAASWKKEAEKSWCGSKQSSASHQASLCSYNVQGTLLLLTLEVKASQLLLSSEQERRQGRI